MKYNNRDNKCESDEWNCPLTPLDITVRQSSSFLSKAFKEDILTKKINTEPPKHEFWQSRISTALIGLTSLSVVFGSVSAYLYFKLVPIIEESSNFNGLVLKYEKNALENLRKHKLYGKTIQQNKTAVAKKADRPFSSQNTVNLNIQNDKVRRKNLFNPKSISPAPLLLQKGQHAENIYFYRHCENLLLINR